MRKRKLNFKELVMDNKQEIKSDLKAMERIETKIDDKHSNQLKYA
ncbi:FbpB family small basic protein [Neobacillus drentensis]